MRAILAACTHVTDTTILKEVEINTQSDLFWYLGSVLPDFKEVTWQGVNMIIFYDELAESKPNKGRLINGVDEPLFGNLVIMGAEEELDPLFTTETIQNYITGVMFETKITWGIFNECGDKTSIVDRAIGELEMCKKLRIPKNTFEDYLKGKKGFTIEDLNRFEGTYKYMKGRIKW